MERFEHLPLKQWCVMGKLFICWIFLYMYIYDVYIRCVHSYIYIYIHLFLHVCICIIAMSCKGFETTAMMLPWNPWFCNNWTADPQLPQPRSRFYWTFRRFQASKKKTYFFLSSKKNHTKKPRTSPKHPKKRRRQLPPFFAKKKRKLPLRRQRSSFPKLEIWHHRNPLEGSALISKQLGSPPIYKP